MPHLTTSIVNPLRHGFDLLAQTCILGLTAIIELAFCQNKSGDPVAGSPIPHQACE